MLTVRNLFTTIGKLKINFHRTSIEMYHAVNEPAYSYETGTEQRAVLDAKLKQFNSKLHDIPIVIGESEIRTQDVKYQVKPFDHQSRLAKFYYADSQTLQKAIDESQKAFKTWDATPLKKRADIFLRAADLIRGKYRTDLVAATMLGQGKTIVQAEIDAACELADFYSFNVQWALESSKWQPISEGKCVNSVEWRAMEGFWAAIAPFNFTAIGGHLAGAPAFMGNVVLWKPSDTAMLSSYIVFKILLEAGVPPGVINFVPADGPVFGEAIVKSPLLAGINFTGSARTFEHLWKEVGNNIGKFRSFPRLIGECGGKNFHFIHPSASNLTHIVNSTIRSAFEYSGQKCSACSRAYIPESKWEAIKSMILSVHKQIKVGSPLEANSFLSAVIDDKAFARIKGYLDYAKSSPNLKIIAGGNCDDSKGFYVEPTVIETSDPKDRIMQEEIFGPVLAVYVYRDELYREILKLIDTTSPYALTGAIFADDEKVISEAKEALRFSAGNFYINDKSTGSVVAQQPFGGSRKSGTNDKAGSPQYIMKFVNVQSIKTQTDVLTEWDYKYMRQTPSEKP